MSGFVLKNKKIGLPFLAATACMIGSIILFAAAGHMAHVLPEQGMAERWSKEGNVAQVSCFFSANTNMTEERLEEFEHTLDSYLVENSIELTSTNPSARLWADAYSGVGRISVSSDRATVEADAVGIGGDFFLFHPQKLLDGNYFSGNDLNLDYCVIDQDAAWQLFGSNHVAGMTVSISGIPYVVQGVIKRSDGRLDKAAGLDSTCIYVAYSTLEKYGTTTGINHYEIVMPDPVDQFAYKYVKEKLGADEKETEVVENSARFELFPCMKRISEFGTRSMNGRAIIYPYWENVARGYEDMVGLLLFLAIVLLVYPLIYVLVMFIHAWKYKSWTFRDIWIKIRDRAERFWENRYIRQHGAKTSDPDRETKHGTQT